MSGNKPSIKLNALLNGTRTLSVSLFSLLTYLYVVRVFGVEKIGGYGFVTTTIGYFSLIAALGIKEYAAREGAIRRHDKKAIEKFASQIFTINLLLSLVSYLALLASMYIFKSFAEYRIELIIQSSVVLFTTLGVEWIYTVYEDFLFLTVRTLIVQIVSLACVFLFVREKSDFNLYIAITVFSTCGGYLLNLIFVRKHCRIGITLKPNIKKHIKSILILGASAIAINIYLNSDITLLKAFKGEYDAGLYYNSAKIYGIIKQVLNSLALVSIPSLTRFVAEGKKKEYNETLSTIFNSLLILIIPIATGMIMLSEELVVIIGGKKFADGYFSLALLSFALIFAVIACIFTNLVLIINKKEKYVMLGTIISAVVNIGLNFFFIPLWSEKGAAITTIIAEIVITIYSWYHSRDDIKLIKVFKTLIKTLISASSIVVVCIVAKTLFDFNFYRIALAVGGSVIAYFGVMIILREEICVAEIRKFLRRFSASKGK